MPLGVVRLWERGFRETLFSAAISNDDPDKESSEN